MDDDIFKFENSYTHTLVVSSGLTERQLVDIGIAVVK